MDVRDILGIEPIAKAGQQTTQAAIDGVSSFLKAVCKPGLEELGFIMKDEVRQWRLLNILRILEKAKGRLDYDGKELNLTANARVGLAIMEEGSKVDDEELQDMWAGLFASSCTPDGQDDSNMNFVDLIRRMSSVEARVLDYACKNCKKTIYPNQLIAAETIKIPFDVLADIAKTDNIYRLDSELDHMRSIELLENGGIFMPGGGFIADGENLDANITPSPLALNLYYRTHSTDISPIEFWGDSLIPAKVDNKRYKSK